MARALSDASVFIAFVSSDYAKNEDSVNIFKYARLTLRKPMVVVAIGDGFEWKQSKLGLLLADEVLISCFHIIHLAKYSESILYVHLSISLYAYLSDWSQSCRI